MDKKKGVKVKLYAQKKEVGEYEKSVNEFCRGI